MRTIFSVVLGLLFIVAGCSKENVELADYKSGKIDLSASAGTTAKVKSNRIGSMLDVLKPTTGGTCLMGGNTDVDAAFKWMISKSGGGDFVVIRFDKSTGYNSYVYNMGGVNSVETLMITSRADANSTVYTDKIRAAEALFIAGGDQANYVNFWKDTGVEAAINYLVQVKGVPVGGTSAGCAILGSAYFSATNGTVTSDQALADPYNLSMTLGYKDFIACPYLENTITDQHFTQRGREGRLVAFMARMSKDYGIVPRGIAVDEQTAVCVDQSGIAKVYGVNKAFFLIQNGQNSSPETIASGIPLTWNRNMQALKVYSIAGSVTGNGSFDLRNFSGGTGGASSYYYVVSGVLYKLI
jgi:cyanophycinase